jgi:hypothetical protein
MPEKNKFTHSILSQSQNTKHGRHSKSGSSNMDLRKRKDRGTDVLTTDGGTNKVLSGYLDREEGKEIDVNLLVVMH